MKDLYELKTELLNLLSEEMPVKQFKKAVGLVNDICNWKETEAEIEAENA